MSHHCSRDRRLRRSEPAALRRVLARVARRLGLDGRDLAVYAEAACGRPWQQLRRPDLLLVLEGLGELAACRAELRRRRGAREEGHCG